MNIKEQKIDADVYFIGLTPAKTKVSVGPYSSVIHLIEHDYNTAKIWYGIADVATTIDELNDDAIKAGVSPPSPGFRLNPQGFGIRLELSDGRWGLARYWSGIGDENKDYQYNEFAFVCETALSLKP